MKILIFLICIISVFSIEKFQNDISKSEKRIRDYKNEIIEVNHAFPEVLKLFYKNQKGDYAVFYDWNGDEVYFKFRRNKFDTSNDKNLIGLFQGQSYRIKGSFAGIASFKDLKTKTILHSPNLYLKEDSDRFWSYDITDKFDIVKVEDLKEKDTILLFKLISFESTSLDELIY